MKRLAKKLVLGGLLTMSLLVTGSSYQIAFGQETDDPVKIEIYKRFYDNQAANKSIAYKAAQDYLAKYAKDKDQYVDYLQKWIKNYEQDDRKAKLRGLINENKFSDAYSVGAQILSTEPNFLRAQIDLGYAGYLAATSKVETYNADALNYARKAIQAIEEGKVPNEWAPFKGKDDTLAYLHFAVGFLTLKTAPEQSIDSLIKAAQYESGIRKLPQTYYYLAKAYESGPYKTLSTAYQTNFADKPETPESKAALEKLNVMMDRMIDAYARAINVAGTDPKTEPNRKEWLAQMSTFYKFRHGGGDAGMTEFIAGIMQKPVPPKP
jgi:hypothetical protein